MAMTRGQTMVLEGEAIAPIVNPSEDEVRNVVSSLRHFGPTSFASLTDESGNYVQVAGGRPWCMVERRQMSPLAHYRANSDGVRRPYKDGAMLQFSAGPVQLQADEWLLAKQAQEIFVAFLRREPSPHFVRWRDISLAVGLTR
jgi:hypothetical protein